MTIEKDKQRVLAGHRAALSNPLVSEQGKREAQEAIDRISREPGDTVLEPGQQTLAVGKPGEGRTLPAEEQQRDRSIGSLKATISNPRTGDAAKMKAREMIAEVGSAADIEEAQRSADAPADERPTGEAAAAEHRNRTVGAAKGTLHRSNVSEEAKERARETLRAAGVDPETI